MFILKCLYILTSIHYCFWQFSRIWVTHSEYILNYATVIKTLRPLLWGNNSLKPELWCNGRFCYMFIFFLQLLLSKLCFILFYINCFSGKTVYGDDWGQQESTHEPRILNIYWIQITRIYLILYCPVVVCLSVRLSCLLIKIHYCQCLCLPLV